MSEADPMGDYPKRRNDAYEPSSGARRAMELAATYEQEETVRVVPMLQPMNQEERIMFFSKRLSVVLGHMKAAIGHEAARAVVDAMKEIADGRA